MPRGLCPLLAAMLLSTSAAAHTPLPSHQHGVATVTLVLAEQQLQVQLLAPAQALLGFEHAPRTPAQQAHLTTTLAALKQPQHWLTLPANAKCQWHTPRVELDLGAEHPDVTAHYPAHCQAPQALTELDFAPAFGLFSNLEQLNVQWVTDHQQQAQTLSANATLIRLD